LKPLIRSRQLRTRAIDESRRVASFVATTEAPCATWLGPEVVRMSGMRTERFLSNPVILNAHNRDDASCVIGRAISLKVENVPVGPSSQSPGQPAAAAPGVAPAAMKMIPGLVTEIEFAESEEALAAWELVRTGFLRAVSIGFMPLKWVELEPGQVDGLGDSQLVGPGVVIVESELYEISLVPVPADPYALLQRGWGEGMRSVLDFTKAVEGRNKAPATTTGSPVQITTTAPAAAAERSAVEGGAPIVPAATVPAPAPAAPAPEAAPAPAPATKAAEKRALEQLRHDVLDVAPTTLREYAEGLLLEEGMTLAAARARLQAEWARRSAPVGTPEPPKTPKAPKATDVSDDDFERAFKKPA
jgi:hypothetical protein